MKRHWKSSLKRIVLLSLFFLLLSIVLGSSMNVIKREKIWLLSENFFSTREADISQGWNLILVNKNYHIPDNYDMKLIELFNGEKVDSRIYPDLQDMFDEARANGLELFVREGYRTQEEQQEIMDEKIMAYMEEGYSRKEAGDIAEKYVAKPGTSEHQLGHL